MTQFWLVSYDISDDKTRQRVHDTLQDYGKRVQYSVFECFLTEQQFSALRAELLDQISQEDSLRWYPLCVWCTEAVTFQGVGTPPDNEDFFLS